MCHGLSEVDQRGTALILTCFAVCESIIPMKKKSEKGRDVAFFWEHSENYWNPILSQTFITRNCNPLRSSALPRLISHSVRFVCQSRNCSLVAEPFCPFDTKKNQAFHLEALLVNKLPIFFKLYNLLFPNRLLWWADKSGAQAKLYDEEKLLRVNSRSSASSRKKNHF